MQPWEFGLAMPPGEMGIKILSTWKIGSDRGSSAGIYDTMTDFGMGRK